MRGAVSRWLNRAWGAPPDPAPPGTWLLDGLSRLYAAGIGLRRVRVERARLPVVSVGSVWVGGTGKTPLAAEIARIAREEGYRPAIILRGYRGTIRRGAVRVPDRPGAGGPGRYGDEACLHAREGRAAVYVAPRRREGVDRAADDGCDVAILDDGMQHRTLARELEIVTLPAWRPFGNGRLLPRGPLREPPGAVGRADLIVLAHAPPSGSEVATLRRLGTLAPNASVVSWKAALTWEPAPPGEGRSGRPDRETAVGVLCAIGNPGSFLDALTEAGCRVAWVAAFPDHHTFRREEIEQVWARAEREGTAAIVTTAKDFVRMEGRTPTRPEGVRLWIARLRLVWVGERAEETVRAALRARIGSKRTG